MSRNESRIRLRQMVLLAILTAIIIVLQVTSTLVPRLATPVSLVLIPITLGAMILGPYAGAALGFVFGLVVLILGFTGADSFTAAMINDNPIGSTLGTVAICLLKSSVAGFAAGIVYKLLSKKWPLPAAFAAAAVTPIVNTGIFIVGALMMSGTISNMMVQFGGSGSVLYYLVVGVAGWNFIFEFLINMVAAPALERLCELAFRKFHFTM